MKNRITTVVLFALWMLVVLGLSFTTIPPRRLTFGHIIQFSLVLPEDDHSPSQDDETVFRR